MTETAPENNLICSFAAFTQTQCGISPYYPENDIILLKNCHRSVQTHLSALHLNDIEKELDNECKLICRRVGIFAELGNYTVCPFHRYSLGIYWRPASRCSHPSHTGKGKAEGNRQGVSVAASHHLLNTYGCVIPVGSGNISGFILDPTHNSG